MSQFARDYLHPNEIQRLLDAAKQFPRYGPRNYALIHLASRHAMRISEVVDLRMSDIDLQGGRIYCRRAKGSVSNTHPMQGDEIRALKKWLRERPEECQDFVFVSERGSPLTRQSAWRIVAETGRMAGLDLKVYPHMLKHSCGYYLANRGYDTRLIQDYMGHKHHDIELTRAQDRPPFCSSGGRHDLTADALQSIQHGQPHQRLIINDQ